MWVVSRLIKNGTISRTALEGEREVNFDDELARRGIRAQERERIGLLGEQFVYEQEIEKLQKCGRFDLARRVQVVSSGDNDYGFDILSFLPDGRDLHIEVKSTTRSASGDTGFWLSRTEKEQAEKDDCWVVYRVCDINTSPICNNLGNIVLTSNTNWEFTVSTWYARLKPSEASPSIPTA